MLSLTAAQQVIVDSPVKTVMWAFDVTDKNLTVYKWSTKKFTDLAYTTIPGAGPRRVKPVSIRSPLTPWPPTTGTTITGESRDFSIINFDGITLARPRTESGLMPPSELRFSLINKNNVYSADLFEGGYVTLKLYASAGSGSESLIRSWKFLIRKVEGAYQQLDFICEDFFQQYIEGYYPGAQYRLPSSEPVWDSGITWEAGAAWILGTSSTVTAYGMKVRDFFPSSTGDIDDDCCIPLPFGTCYIPVRSAYIGTDRYYVMGPTIAGGVVLVYTVSACRSPRDYSVKVEYLSPAYNFDQYTKISASGYALQTVQAMIAAGPSNGLYANGDNFYDLPLKFSRSDTAAITNPADVIEYVLKDIGVAAADIDSASFAAAHATFDVWGLAFNGAFWKVAAREKVLTTLLAMCHSTLIVGEKLELHVLDSTSQKTVTAANVIREGNTGIGTFSYAAFTRGVSDCGNVSYYPSSDSQDIGINVLVPAKTTKTHIDPDPLQMPFVAAAAIAEKITKLFLQRKLLKKSEERFRGKSTLIALQPSDFISFSGANYGGVHDVIIDSLKISRDLSVDLVCTGFSDTIDNYA